MPTPQKLIAFDLDGTIVDSLPSMVSCIQRTCIANSIPAPEESFVKSLFGLDAEQLFSELCGAARASHDPSALANYYRELYRRATSGRVSAFENVPELIRGLHATGVVLGIVTGKRTATAERELQALELLDLFSGVMGSDGFARPKPYPDPLLELMLELGISEAGEVIVVGDSNLDMEMGRAAGAATVAVTWGALPESELRRSSPHAVARHPSELKDILYQLLRET